MEQDALIMELVDVGSVKMRVSIDGGDKPCWRRVTLCGACGDQLGVLRRSFLEYGIDVAQWEDT